MSRFRNRPDRESAAVAISSGTAVALCCGHRGSIPRMSSNPPIAPPWRRRRPREDAPREPARGLSPEVGEERRRLGPQRLGGERDGLPLRAVLGEEQDAVATPHARRSQERRGPPDALSERDGLRRRTLLGRHDAQEGGIGLAPCGDHESLRQGVQTEASRAWDSHGVLEPFSVADRYVASRRVIPLRRSRLATRDHTIASSRQGIPPRGRMIRTVRFVHPTDQTLFTMRSAPGALGHRVAAVPHRNWPSRPPAYPPRRPPLLRRGARAHWRGALRTRGSRLVSSAGWRPRFHAQ
jgi:hypothetical protein